MFPLSRTGLLVLLVRFSGDVVSKPYDDRYCFGDICNKWSEIQFCSKFYKKCRDCAEVVMDCGTDDLPKECIQFCVSHYVKSELERVKRTTCSQPSITNGVVTSNSSSNGRVNFNSVVKFSCFEGFVLKVIDSKRCLGNDTWTEIDDPICLDVLYINWHIIGIICVSVLCLLFLVFILILLIKSCQRQNVKKKSAVRRYSESQSKDNEEENGQSSALLSNSTKMENERTCDNTKGIEYSKDAESSKSRVSLSSASSTPCNDSNPEVNQTINGKQTMGNINVSVVVQGNNNINGQTDEKECGNANGMVSKCQDIQPEENQTKDKTPTKESQETVEASQETQMAEKGADLQFKTLADYARNEPNLVGYNDRSLAATGSRHN